MVPLEIMVIGLPRDRFSGQILPELRALRTGSDVRLVDLLLVSRDERGVVSVIKTTDPDASGMSRRGEIAPLLAGLGGGPGTTGESSSGAATELPAWAQEWNIAGAIPPGSSAAIAVFEHRWATALLDAVESAGGAYLVDEVVHPEVVTEPALSHPAG